MKRNRRLIKMVKAQRHRCALCDERMVLALGRQNTATIDHVVPRALGGNSRHTNIQAACRACNIAKGRLYEGPRYYWNLRDGYGTGTLRRPIGETARCPKGRKRPLTRDPRAFAGLGA